MGQYLMWRGLYWQVMIYNTWSWKLKKKKLKKELNIEVEENGTINCSLDAGTTRWCLSFRIDYCIFYMKYFKF